MKKVYFDIEYSKNKNLTLNFLNIRLETEVIIFNYFLVYF